MSAKTVRNINQVVSSAVGFTIIAISEKGCGTTGLDFFGQMRHDFDGFGKATPEVITMEKKQIPQPAPNRIERPIPPKIYPVIDNDLARDNVENDLPAADLQELQ